MAVKRTGLRLMSMAISFSSSYHKMYHNYKDNNGVSMLSIFVCSPPLITKQTLLTFIASCVKNGFLKPLTLSLHKKSENVVWITIQKLSSTSSAQKWIVDCGQRGPPGRSHPPSHTGRQVEWCYLQVKTSTTTLVDKQDLGICWYSTSQAGI